MSISPQLQLVQDIAALSLDPLCFVKYTFPWGTGDLAQFSGPKAWQEDILTSIGSHLQAPKTRFTPLRIAVSSGKGIGKSALIAMIVNWGMSTCEDCRVVITANTAKQLATKTSPEAQKWFRLAVNSFWWDVRSESIVSKLKDHARLWRTDFIPWSANNPEAFAGLHNQGKRILVIFDEASSISDKIWETAEGFLTDSETEIIWLAFGNPTINTGTFHECFGKQKHRWLAKQIDSRKVEGSNQEQANQWVEDYGEDSDFVRIWVRGEFPRSGSFQFISSESVEKCRKYKAVGYELLPKIVSCDVARFGDDQTVIGVRQGRRFRILTKARGLDLVQTSNKLIEHIGAEKPDAAVIDTDGIGAGVFDTLTHRGYGKNLYEFHGNGTPDDVGRYYNRRAEVWGLGRDALDVGMEIPNDPELAEQLTQVQYGYSPDQKIQLEKKESMKLRGYASPDIGDALAMTFAVTIQAAAPEAKEYMDRTIGVGAGWHGQEGGWMR
jgi:hypothetical protein